MSATLILTKHHARCPYEFGVYYQGNMHEVSIDNLWKYLNRNQREEVSFDSVSRGQLSLHLSDEQIEDIIKNN